MQATSSSTVRLCASSVARCCGDKLALQKGSVWCGGRQPYGLGGGGGGGGSAPGKPEMREPPACFGAVVFLSQHANCLPMVGSPVAHDQEVHVGSA